jgi:hypothetical protein
MKLDEIQATFAEALVVPESITRTPAWSARGARDFTGSARLTPVEQLDVYREQFWLRHVACLAEDFPVLAALVGEEKFGALVQAYVAAHPPTEFQMRVFGSKLADFLETHEKDDRLLADLARVEWAFIDAFDAADAPPLDPNSIATISEDAWPSARLALHPSLQRMRLLHSAHKMREKWRENEELRPIARAPREPAYVVVYRQKFLMYVEEMDALAFAMLERIARGEALGAAGDALASETGRGEEIEARIGEWFTRWSGLGWISRVEI